MKRTTSKAKEDPPLCSYPIANTTFYSKMLYYMQFNMLQMGKLVRNTSELIELHIFLPRLNRLLNV